MDQIQTIISDDDEVLILWRKGRPRILLAACGFTATVADGVVAVMAFADEKIDVLQEVWVTVSGRKVVSAFGEFEATHASTTLAAIVAEVIAVPGALAKLCGNN